jgi:hypothetical protein
MGGAYKTHNKSTVIRIPYGAQSSSRNDVDAESNKCKISNDEFRILKWYGSYVGVTPLWPWLKIVEPLVKIAIIPIPPSHDHPLETNVNAGGRRWIFLKALKLK